MKKLGVKRFSQLRQIPLMAILPHRMSPEGQNDM